jgi:hypothetical protein
VSVAWQTYRRTKDKALLNEILDPLVKTMNYMPRNPANGRRLGYTLEQVNAFAIQPPTLEPGFNFRTQPAIAKPLAMSAITETYKSVCMDQDLVSL